MKATLLIAVLALTGCIWPIDPDIPIPDPDNPDTITWTNQYAGYRVRLKDYRNSPGRMHQGRKCSVKIDTQYHRVAGMTGENTKAFVDDGELIYYGIDEEHGKHDLAFADMNRFPEQQNKPCYLKLYKDGELIAVYRIPEWSYTTIYAEQTVEVPDDLKETL